jgi:hypothetical protein
LRGVMVFFFGLVLFSLVRAAEKEPLFVRYIDERTRQ